MRSLTAGDFQVVQFSTPQSQEIDRELKKLDPDLFIDPERDPDWDRIVWTVKYRVGHGAVLVTDWRDPVTLEPLELSWGLWSKIKVRENRNMHDVRAELQKENEKLREQRANAQYLAYEEIARDLIPRIKGAGHSAVLHRSQALRRSRDRARSRGHRV